MQDDCQGSHLVCVTLPVQVEHPAVLLISASLQSGGCALPPIAYNGAPA